MDKFSVSTKPDGGCFQERPSVPSPTSHLLLDVNVALQDHLRRQSSRTVAMPSAECLDYFAQAPSLPPMQQAAQYPPSGPTSQVPSSGWMPHPPYPPTAMNLHSQLPSCEETSPLSEETPVYVNAKQFNRILKRRGARQRLNENSGSVPRGRKSYMHESRHAARRPRGPGGKFLNKNQTPKERELGA